jgi:hypothetical protein
MKLDLSDLNDLTRGQIYFEKLVKDGAKIDLKRVNKPRSIKQNSYVHVLFQLWSNHFGYTLDEGKQVVKKQLDYVYHKNGETFLVKTSGMDTKQLSVFVDRFRNWSASEGCYLPTSEEYLLRHFDYSKEIEKAEMQQSRYGF